MNFNIMKRWEVILIYTFTSVQIVTYIEKPHIDFHYKVMIYVLIYIIAHVDLNRQYKKGKEKEMEKGKKKHGLDKKAIDYGTHTIYYLLGVGSPFSSTFVARA